jgi:ammonia channel protein AmtB
LGTLIVWFGWFGFTAGSTQGIVNLGEVAARTMVATTISASCSCMVALAMGYAADFYVTRQTKLLNLSPANNGAMAGLVAISAGCAVVELYSAAIIGCGAGFIYFSTSKMLKKCGIDDGEFFHYGVLFFLLSSPLVTDSSPYLSLSAVYAFFHPTFTHTHTHIHTYLVVDAVPIHFFCGAYGLIMAALLTTKGYFKVCRVPFC